jgi:hypothetical protein
VSYSAAVSWQALVLGFLGAVIGGVATQLVAGRYSRQATAQRELAGKREEWGRRVKRALTLAVADSERARVGGFALLDALLDTDWADETDRRELQAVGVALAQYDVDREDALAGRGDVGDTEDTTTSGGTQQ